MSFLKSLAQGVVYFLASPGAPILLSGYVLYLAVQAAKSNDLGHCMCFCTAALMLYGAGLTREDPRAS